MIVCDRFNGFRWFCVKNLCTKYCCKSLNKQSSWVQERINPFYINSYGENSFGLRTTFRNELSSCTEVWLYIQTNDRRVQPCWDYVPESYIAADSTFHPPVWSECSSSSFRTTTTCESFHVHFKALLWSTHPNILFLHLHCRKIQNEPYMKMRSVDTGRFKKNQKH